MAAAPAAAAAGTPAQLLARPAFAILLGCRARCVTPDRRSRSRIATSTFQGGTAVRNGRRERKLNWRSHGHAQLARRFSLINLASPEGLLKLRQCGSVAQCCRSQLARRA